VRFLLGVVVGVTIGRSGARLLIKQALKIPSEETLSKVDDKLRSFMENLDKKIVIIDKSDVTV